jgi:hypothetical protein
MKRDHSYEIIIQINLMAYDQKPNKRNPGSMNTGIQGLSSSMNEQHLYTIIKLPLPSDN